MLTKFIHQPEFDPTNGDWYWVTTSAYGGPGGAYGDDSHDDTSAIQAVINAAASAGKGVYLPAGTYKMADADPALSIPSNTTMRGAGVTSILKQTDSGGPPVTLKMLDKSTCSFKDFKILGTETGTDCSLQCISIHNTDNVTIDGITFDGCDMAVKIWEENGSSNRSNNITITNCETLSNTYNPFYFSYCADVYVSYCDIDALTTMGVAPPHHFYINEGSDGVYVSDCTLTNGIRECIDVHTDGNVAAPTDINFTDITLTNVARGIWVQDSTYVTVDGLTATSNRFSNGGSEGCWFLLVTDADYVTFKNFDITGSTNTDYLVCVWATTGTHNLLQDGSITNCDNYSSTPRGLYVDSAGQYPAYDNVSVNGTTVNYP